jgi:hypothetical protein
MHHETIIIPVASLRVGQDGIVHTDCQSVLGRRKGLLHNCRKPLPNGETPGTDCQSAQPGCSVGQTIGFCRLLQWACGPRSFMKKRGGAG